MGVSDNYRDFLVELGTEELPPKQIGELATALADNIAAELHQEGLAYEAIKSYATPRRLAVMVTALSTIQPDTILELRGPPVKVAFTADGCPTLAAKKFAQNCGVALAQLEQRQEQRGTFLFCRKRKPGLPTSTLLPKIVQRSIKKLVIPRAMRWGAGKISFVRPVHWVVMLFGNEIVAGEILGITAANKTVGHRFHHPKFITLRVPHVYETLLATQGYVIADPIKRQHSIAEQLKSAVTTGTVIVDPALLAEVTNLVEWPVVLVGTIDPHFLEMPPEILITAMEKQQRYFPVTGAQGNLLPYFVIVSNIVSADPTQVIRGNERVLRARLTDASYFYYNDLRIPLSSYQEKLKAVVFQSKLGTMYDKTVRLEALGGYIAQQLKSNVALAKRSAFLAKADLLTEVVRELPELQGVMGDYYARRHESPMVATAIREQYLPRFAQDRLPTTELGAILALADRIDNLVGLFGINRMASGEKDPFGLRRAATGIIRIILAQPLELDLLELLEQAKLGYKEQLPNREVVAQVLHFIYERLRYFYLEEGKRVEIFRAVLATTPTNLYDFTLRFAAVETFSKLPEAAALGESYKRISNILAQAEYPQDIKFVAALVTEEAEHALATMVTKIAPKVQELYRARRYLEILQLLGQTKEVLPRFFSQVMVMVAEPELRFNRLALLRDLQNLFVLVADLSWVGETATSY